MMYKNIKIILLVASVLLVTSCASMNRLNTLESIGSDDLTSKKPINILVYAKQAEVKKSSLEEAANTLFNEAGKYVQQGKLTLNSTGISQGDWKEIADNYFHADEYNWIFEIRDEKYPEIAFQNFYDDSKASREVHYRFCQLRTIQFANISLSTLNEAPTYWQNEIYSAAIDGVYFLFKGNDSMVTQTFTTLDGKLLTGSVLGETDQYTFIFLGETNLYILPKKISG